MAVTAVTRYKPECDKIMRLHAQTAMIENGFVYIPETASWLAEYLHEMTVFPKGKHDDQVDFDRSVPRLVQEAFPGPRHIRALPHAGRETRAAENLLDPPSRATGHGLRADLLGPPPQHRSGWHRRDVCRGCPIPDPRWLDQAR